MGKLFPPFKVDIAGALCVPFTLRDARNRYQHGQISLSALRAIENKEICKLMERLKLEGIEVVTDGGFRSYDFLEGWEGIRCRNNADSSLEKKLEVTGRIGLLHHPILEDFVFLLKNTAENVLPKQHIPSPGKMLMRILRETEAGCLKSVYPDLNILLDDLAVAYKKLLEGLYEAGCRYVQFEGVKSMLTDEAARLNNRVLRERPEGLFVAFQLHGYNPLDGLLEQTFHYVVGAWRIKLFGKLLADCTATAGILLHQNTTLHHGTEQRDGINPRMFGKAYVFRCNQRIDNMGRQIIVSHKHAVLLAIRISSQNFPVF